MKLESSHDIIDLGSIYLLFTIYRMIDCFRLDIDDARVLQSHTVRCINW